MSDINKARLEMLMAIYVSSSDEEKIRIEDRFREMQAAKRKQLTTGGGEV